MQACISPRYLFCQLVQSQLQGSSSKQDGSSKSFVKLHMEEKCVSNSATMAA